MAPTAPTVPARIGIGVRVKTRKEPCRTGSVQATTGQRQWMVLFDGQDEVEAASSNQLQIYLEAYGQHQGTPPPSPSKNISQTTKPTGRKAPRPLRDRGNEQISYAENRSDDDDDDDDHDDDDDDDEEDSDNESQQSGFSIDSGNLATPRAEPSTQNRGHRRAVGTPTDLFSRGSTTPSGDNYAADSTDENYFHAADGEDFDDRIEEEEDDDGRGTRMSWVDQNGEDREAFVDEPQKKALYEAAKAKMEAEKRALIQEEHKITKTVETKEKYDIGGRVEGRARSDYAGERGTITKVIDDTTYVIEFDDSGLTCEVKKGKLKLSHDPPQDFEWKAVQDHITENLPTEFPQCGAIGVNFEDFLETDVKARGYDHPFGRLVMSLWPGDWRRQLDRLNESFKEENTNRKTPYRLATEDEWWTIWGIIIFSGRVGKGGIEALYDNNKPIISEIPTINMKDIMPMYRTKEILKRLPNAFHGDDESDPWNPIATLVAGFNNNRARMIASSHCLVLDESMSSWHPTTTKYGGLPFLSFILRKPKPLGTEFKVIADSETGAFICIEVQKGKIPMMKESYSLQLGATAGCSLRLIEKAQYCGSETQEDRRKAKEVGKRYLIYGDSWFTGRRLLVALGDERGPGHEYFGALKTNHSGIPKEEVEKIMKEWPAGSYLVFECEKLGVFYVGYKYSWKRKVCHFIGTWNAGSTTPGEPYKSKWPDEFGNLQSRDVLRPDCISRYFNSSNVIDVDNSLRQNELALEQHWRTLNPWFRIDTTIIGITVTDAFLLARYSAPSASHIVTMSMADWAGYVAHDFFTMRVSRKARNVEAMNLDEGFEVGLDGAVGTDEELCSAVTMESVMLGHQITRTSQKSGQGGAAKKRKCSMSAEGCKSIGADVRNECSHPSCLAKTNGPANRFGSTTGVFICENNACRWKHWKEVFESAKSSAPVQPS